MGALNDVSVKADLLAWRDTYADRPRTADCAVQVLSRVLAWSVGRGHLTFNAMTGAETLDRAERADQIWSAEDIGKFCAATSPEVGRALKLACVTGLSRSDLVDLKWEQVGDTAIVRERKKSRGRLTVTIPLIAEAREILAEIGRLPTGHVLLTTRGTPWTASGLEGQVIKAKTKASIDRHLHDARGTFATRLRMAGLTLDDIALVMGWKKERVERILNRYVDSERIIANIAGKLSANESGTKLPTDRPTGV